MDLSAGAPFLRVTRPCGEVLPWVVVRAPVVTRAQHVRLNQLAAEGCRFAGATSCLGFPGAGFRDERDYGLLCEAWLHCFRDPDRFLPPNGSRARVSESDFTDPLRVDPRLAARTLPPELVADVVHVSGAEPWRQRAKNWPLAARCLRRLAEEAHLRILVVDAPPGAEPLPGVRLTGPLEWPLLLAVIAAARCLFVPAVLDASPRVLAEALCLDVPVVVNQAILGGWQYVNPFTGIFFGGEDDVVPAVLEVVAAARRPRAWFMAHHGPVRAGARVLRLLRPLDSALPALTHVLLASDRGGWERAVPGTR
ncbi:glycosyltransferase involved in cell wall biosynthesis [Streptomyces sp. B3I8]|nr:glycosyltransferase involved in cell wall biosynthesis [Streptomyces sp. B3I8]